MNVSLTAQLERYVEQKVKSGGFTSASEVVRAGLRLLQENDEAHAARLEALRADVRAGAEQLRRGEGKAGTTVFERVRREHQVPKAK